MLNFVNVVWGARCGESARRVLLGETRSRGHAHSVRRQRESAPWREAPHGLSLSRLVSTIRFDRWMQEKHPYCPFARYADDAVVHCGSEKQAQWKLLAIGKRLEECGLRLNLEKSAIVYCKGSDRREAHARTQFTFLGYTFRPRGAKDRYGKLFQNFLPAVSQEAMKKMRRTIRSWKLPRQTSASLGELAARYNPILRGWLNYYGHFYKSALYRVFVHFEEALVRWLRRKYRKLERHEGRSYRWIWRVARRQPGLFVHWRAYGQAGGRTMGAV